MMNYCTCLQTVRIADGIQMLLNFVAACECVSSLDVRSFELRSPSLTAKLAPPPQGQRWEQQM